MPVWLKQIARFLMLHPDRNGLPCTAIGLNI
jgi:hypothetical protein